MAFCSNCGERIEEGANFCNKCGKPVNENNSSRKVTYEGEIHKCPNCGGPLLFEPKNQKFHCI